MHILLPAGIPQLTTNALPPGALGIWYAKTLTTVGGNPVVPNALSAVPVSANLIRFPRRNFAVAGGNGFININTVATDNAVVGPDGLTQASTLVGTGSWQFYYNPGTGTTLPAGTYTVGVNVKRNTGSDQSFKIGNAGDSNLSGTLTATASWQRFSFTFTVAPGVGIFPSLSFGTSQSLQICDLEVFAGSSDLGPETLAGHFYAGSGAYKTNQPTLTSSVLDFGSDGAHFGSMQFLNPVSATNLFTVLFVSKEVGGATNNAGFLISRFNNYLQFSYCYNAGAGGFPQVNWGTNGTLTGGGGQKAGLSSLLGNNWNVVGARVDGTNVDLFINGALYGRNISSVSMATNPTIFDDLTVGIGNIFGGDGFLGQMAAWAIWPRALSNAEVAAATKILASNSGVAINNTHVIVFEGDSVTAGAGGFVPTTNGFAYYSGPNSTPRLFGWNYSAGGAMLQGNSGNDLITRAATGIVDLYAHTFGAFQTQTKPIFSVLIGINDINVFVANGFFNDASGTPNQTIAQWEAAYAAYLDSRRAAGYTVVVCTNFSGGAAASTYETTRESIATTIRTWPGVHCDYVVDFSNLATTMGADGASLALQGVDFAGTPDNQHPNDAGTALLVPEYTAVVNTIP